MLERHPGVELVPGSAPELGLSFGGREVRVGDASAPIAGLMELIDNNPVVCARCVSVPDPASTLALIGLGPLIRAGLLTDTPTLLTNFPLDEAKVDAFLALAGWSEGCVSASEDVDLGGILAASTMGEIETPTDWDEIDALYDECFGRAFFVRRVEEGDWSVEIVADQMFVAYRLRVSVGESTSLVTAQLMGTPAGKLGPAQIVHAFNIMCGFEESLGIA